MTQLLTRPVLRVKSMPSEAGRPPVLAASLAAVTVAGTGLFVAIAVSVAAWFAAAGGTFGNAVRVGALGWLVAQGGGLHVPGADITVIPLGSCALVAWLLHLSGRWVGATSRPSSPREFAVAASTLTGVYVVSALLTWFATRTAGYSADLWRSMLAAVVLAGVFGSLGVARSSGMASALLIRVPRDAGAAARAAAAGAATMFVAGGVALTASIATHFSTTVTLAESMRAGVVGGAVVALVGAAVVPNALLCASAYLTGAGFVIGAGTSVSPAEVLLGPLPAFPLLGALPASGGAEWQLALTTTPLLAGAVAGAVLVRSRSCRTAVEAALWSAGAGLSAGLAFGFTTWFATGAVGDERLRMLGPDVPGTLFLASVACCLGAMLSGLVCWWSHGRRSSDNGYSEPACPTP